MVVSEAPVVDRGPRPLSAPPAAIRAVARAARSAMPSSLDELAPLARRRARRRAAGGPRVWEEHRRRRGGPRPARPGRRLDRPARALEREQRAVGEHAGDESFAILDVRVGDPPGQLGAPVDGARAGRPPSRPRAGAGTLRVSSGRARRRPRGRPSSHSIGDSALDLRAEQELRARARSTPAGSRSSSIEHGESSGSPSGRPLDRRDPLGQRRVGVVRVGLAPRAARWRCVSAASVIVSGARRSG